MRKSQEYNNFTSSKQNLKTCSNICIESFNILSLYRTTDLLIASLEMVPNIFIYFIGKVKNFTYPQYYLRISPKFKYSQSHNSLSGGSKHTTSQKSRQNPHQLNSCRATTTANYSAEVTGLLARC